MKRINLKRMMKKTLAMIAIVLVVISSLEAFGLTTDSETPLVSEDSGLGDLSDATLEGALEASEVWERTVNVDQTPSDPPESEPLNGSDQDQSERDQPSEGGSQEAIPSSTGASIRIHQLQGRYDYLSGEVIQLHVGATLDGIFPVGTVFEIRIPRRHILDNATFQVSAISGQTPPTITRTDDAITGEFVIRYTLNVSGGLEFDLPIQMVTHNGNTPNGFEIPITARLMGGNDELLADEIETTFTINTVEPELTKRVMEFGPSPVVISGYRWSALSADNVTVGPAGLESMTRPGYLSEDFRELVPVSFTYHINSPGTFGNRTYESLVFYDTIPEGALFVQELNPGWTFDETTRVARFERTINTTLNNAGIGSGDVVGIGNFTINPSAQILQQNSPVLRLYFPGAPIGETFTNEVRVVGTGLGTDCDVHPLDCFELSDDIRFSLGAETRRFHGNVGKTPHENPAVTATNNVIVTSNRTLGEDTRGLGAGTRNYTINVTHRVSFASGHTNNPSHLPLLPLQNVVVRDHSLDPALYFRGITIPARGTDVFTRTSPSTHPEIFGPREPGTLDVSVLLVDGTTVTLAEDLTITAARSFDFSDFGFDPEDVIEFIVEATEGSYFLPPPSAQTNENRLQITVHTGPRDPEERIVPPGETGRAFTNSVTMERNTLNHDPMTNSSTATLAYRLVEPVLGLQHGPAVRRTTGTGLPNFVGNSLTGVDNIFRIGERRHFRLDVNMMNILAGTSIETDQILVLVPEGLEFVPGSVEFHTMAATQSTMSAAQLNQELEVIPDFNGTGQTALRFNLRPFSRTGNVAGTQTVPIRAFSILYQVEVTEAAEGTQISPAHLHWSNRDEITPAVLPLNATGGNIPNMWTSRGYLVPDVHDLAGDGEESIISEGQARVNVQPPPRRVSFSKATPQSMTIMSAGQPLTNMLGNEITYVLTVGTQGTIPGDVLETNVIVDLLPVGMEFIPGSQTVQHFINSSSPMTNASIAPEVVENYRGTGRTALIFPLDNITLNAGFSATTTTTTLRITYRTRITSLAEGGANVNDAYFSWTNRDVFLPGTFVPATGITGFPVADVDRSSVLDVWDLNGTGNPDDTIIRSRATIHYTPPFELLMFKEVRGNLDSNFLTYPAAGTSEVGTYVDYQLRLFNNSPGDIHPANFQVVDVLPFAGDSRGSTFTPTLAGPITLPAGYRVYYTLDAVDPALSMSEFVADANWVTTVIDYSAVTAIRIEMNEDHILTRGTQVAFEIRLNLPDDPDFTIDDLAANTFYTSTTGGADYILSNEAHLRFAEFTVDGYVFHDLDDNGILDHDVDRILANHVVELIRVTSTGYEVVATTTTDERGFYRFTTIRPGNYQIRVQPPEGLDHITENIGGPYGATAFDPATARSVLFTLNGTNVSQRINAGFEGELQTPLTGLSDDLPFYLSLVTVSLTTLLLLRRLKRKKQALYES